MRQAWALSALIFGICVFAFGRLFTIEYLDRMDSIEAAYIGLARYAAANAWDFSWFPLWYNGIPYQNTYPPLLHWIVAAWSRIASISPALAFHQAVALFFCACPVAVFWLGRRLSQSNLCGFFAGLAAALLSPAAWLITDVRHDMGSVWNPRRLMNLVVYGEGTHQASMTFLILAVIAIDWAARKRTPWSFFVASLLCAATVLCNWIGGLCLVLFVAAYALSVPFRDWPRIALCCAAGALLIAPWIVPSTVRVIQFNASTIGGDFTGVYRAVLPKLIWIGGTIGAALLARRVGWPRHAVFALAATLFTAGVTLTIHWAGLAILPQPSRYHSEMELAMALGFGSLVLWASRRLPLLASWGLVAALTAGSVYPLIRCRRYARQEYKVLANIEKTVEWEVAKVLEAKLPGCRVFLAGSVSYWNTAFTNQPNVLGGFDQGVTNFMIRVSHYVTGSDDGVPRGREREYSLVWLKALGAHAVHTGGPNSREHYKPWRNPRKFDGALEKLWESGDDYLYRVPQRSCSIARVVPRASLPSRTPVNGIDIEPLLAYVAALDDPALPDAPARWTTGHSFEVDVPKLTGGQVISLQMSYVDGWHADSGTLRKDAFGQTVLEPGCSGCTVRLNYDGGRERKIAIGLSLATLALFGAALALQLRNNAQRA